MTFLLPPARAKVAPDFTDLPEMKGNKVRLARNSRAKPPKPQHN